MTTKIVQMDFEGKAVTFNADGWINATEAAARFGKEPAQWLRLPDAIRYLEGLERTYGKITYVKTSRARADRGGGTWIHPRLAVKFARWLSVDFEIWCDVQVDALVRGEINSRSMARRQAAVGYKSLCDALSLTYEAIGKTTKPHHYMNEARLINEVITGAFKGRNRDHLTQAELELIMLVENRDVLLIGQGKDFAARKNNLLGYVGDLQMKLIGSKAA
ncbi:KilA-N domain-containing protein [Pseudomonas sp. 10B1]|uniref:KilA-N domain-containing protein n=1 Tax=unclassified Pseudomonas TaxID=196821 RepID=UPI002B231C56|nr:MULTISPECIES: KilA-N domain-containing protein [unclassified Pseudomonas]MEA9996301.1 KilA-N domain-containing protein [Pseudomonas sp. AA4]MEB0086657.1 KilA-N domain-containing protein [Pseudomonas sp. RTI1]MEB0124707.1 KilA-N domain-containing protein [Pseudomonas sp. CCC1.2]MEB0154971.1 KilA-N domain-containing protein [Pseudomonas sp. CCC4.3]MEB0217920.1 KilA-N domain-containing protein [Pseudomonas sp. AB12(2023)]